MSRSAFASVQPQVPRDPWLRIGIFMARLLFHLALQITWLVWSGIVTLLLVTPLAAKQSPPSQELATEAPEQNSAETNEPTPSAPPQTNSPPPFPGAKTLPPLGPYRPLFFDNDFSALQDPNHPALLGERLKNRQLDITEDSYLFSMGGELRHRAMDQRHRLHPGPDGETRHDLWRWRHYADLKCARFLRGYVESIHAESFGEDLAPAAIDENQWDLLNAFVDFTPETLFDTQPTLRVGRQELIFGKQRLVSALDWGNTRRTFEGFRLLTKGDDWKHDLFVVNPVNAATGFRPPAQFDTRFDAAARDVLFSGSYLTYTGIENASLDLYWLWLLDPHPLPHRPDGRRHTIGSRYACVIPVSDQRAWDTEFETGYQFGSDSHETVQAGFATSVIGHQWKTLAGKPRLSGTFYYGSGDTNPSDGRNQTFSVLFPLAHAYWGLSDNLSGQNLLDWSLQADVKPTERSSLTVAQHFFQLASANDTAYTAGGTAIGSPGNGRSLGDALDLYGYYSLNPNFDIQCGYSWFWYGSYIERTVPRDDASQFYVQTSLRY